MFKLFSCGAGSRWLPGVLLFYALAGNPALAHEFWIEPTNYRVEQNAGIEAFLRNGERFSGSSISYLEGNTIRFDLLSEDREDPVVARLGDNPALQMRTVQDGLNVVVHQRKVSVISYPNWEKFQRFAEHKDFDDILLRHRARSLPEKKFSEAYSRYSRSLVAVGDGAGSDRQAGLEVELVAQQNPYTDDVGRGLSGKVEVTLPRTDDRGLVTLPVKPSHSYLVDMVVLREPSEALATTKKVVWETLWASLTFAVP